MPRAEDGLSMPTIRYNVDRKRGLDNFSQAGFSVRIVVAENSVSAAIQSGIHNRIISSRHEPEFLCQKTEALTTVVAICV
jgi:hypothetical protein